MQSRHQSDNHQVPNMFYEGIMNTPAFDRCVCIYIRIHNSFWLRIYIYMICISTCVS